MRTVIILRGLPACGKSTFARELLRKEAKRWKRINKDDLRNMLDDGSFDHDREDFIRSVQDTLILKALRDGYDVVIDNTHLVPQTLRKLHRLLESVGNIKVLEKCFNVTVAECKKRNALREGKARVPDNVIDGMSKGAGIDRGRVLEDKEFYYAPKDQQESYIANQALPKAIIVDLDGTLALMGDRSPFDASQCDIKDKPNKPVIACVKAMYAAGYKIVFMSGREDKDRDPSKRFIEQYLPGLEYELHMRATADSRKDSIVKRELFDANVRDSFNVEFCLDDRDQVVRDTWRAMGLTCFQVAEGNF